MSLISEAQFVDLYLGKSFSDVKGLAGAAALRVEAPASWAEELQALRERCLQRFAQDHQPEFSVLEDNVVLRVTQIPDAYGDSVFVLRKSNACLRAFPMLGYANEVVEALLAPTTRGLVLFCGEMSTGKTSSAASLLAARLERHGGFALAVEDPPETALHGTHGAGRCIQIPVTRQQGYEEALIRALRTGADLLLIGEIRDTPTAAQAVRASINGHFIIATLHAGSIAQAVERIAELAEPEIPNVRAILAQGLVAVMVQALGTQGGIATLKVRSLLLTANEGPAIREKIRTNRIQQLDQEAEQQSQRSYWT